MKVLFVKDVPGSAHAGEVKDVATGHWLHFLQPKKLAIPAGTGAVEQIRKREDAIKRRTEQMLVEARETANRMRKLTLTVHAKAGEGTRLFGSVTNADIAQQLKRDAGIDLDKRKIEVEPPIKTLGPHEVKVQLHPDVTETLRIVVAAQ